MPGGGRSAGPSWRGRLRRSRDIRRVLRTGSQRRSQRLVLYVAPGEGPSRAAWITGRHVGSAVARNRARRLMREAWAALASDVGEGHDLVWVARRPLARASAAELIEELRGLLREAGLIG